MRARAPRRHLIALRDCAHFASFLGFSVWVEKRERETVNRLHTCTATENNCKLHNFVDMFTKYFGKKNSQQGTVEDTLLLVMLNHTSKARFSRQVRVADKVLLTSCVRSQRLLSGRPP